MAKSLDGLIRHLVDEIALRGEEGALPSDFVEHVNTYYGKRPRHINGSTTHNDNDEPNCRSFTTDRPFQEQVWKWLTRHPEIRVGKNNEGNNLTLFEVEALNTSHPNQEQSKQPNDGHSISAHIAATLISHENWNPLDGTKNGSSGPAKKRSKASSTKTESPEESKLLDSLRLYGSEDRMWQVAAGHGPDHAKVPALDFICLSIIAARGPKGILQPELVAVSGQDKRSLPKRTDRLHENGYIEKRPVVVAGSRTSLCTLRKFVTAHSIVDRTSRSTEETSSSHRNNDSVLDLLALAHGIFDNLRDLEIIAADDLKKKLGVWGLRWPMKVLARIVRQLEALGCIKQVRAQANSNLPTALYFRCIKLIREPDETEWQSFISPHRGLPNSTAAGDDDDPDADGEADGEYGAEPSTYSQNNEEGPPIKNLREVGRPIAQWDGDHCLNNFLFDLIDNSGTRGMSTMEIKCYALGGLVKRPLEYQLGRLVNQWQISQPPYLRHLAIIRDTAVNKSITHYIHYSYENFKALVDSSKASWEAVETVSEGKKGKHPAAGVHPEPDLDDFGFPTLQASLFQGHHNDAPASECALAVKAQPIQLTSSDLIPKKLGDETYVLQYGARRCMPQTHRGPRTSEEPIESTPQRLSFKPRGRPRKVPRTGLPANIDSMTPKEIKKFANLQQAAIKYDVLKIEKEIDRRVDAGEDPATALDVVLREVADEHAQLELPPSLAAKAVRVRSTMPGAKEHKPILPDAVLTDTAGRVEMISAKATRKVGRANGKKKQPPYEYMPSVAAHSWLVVPQAPSAPTRLSESKPKAGPNLSCMRRGSIDVAYLPSIAAHTQPIIQSPALALNIAATRKQKSAQRLIREKRKISQDLSAVPYPQLSQNTPNNLADHSLPARKKHKRSLPPESREDAAFGHIPTGDVSLKRKRSIIESSESNKRITIEYLPSIATHAQKIFRPIEPLLGGIISNQPNSRRPVRGYVRKNVNRVAIQEASTRKVPSGRTESEIKNYKKQLNDIKRPEDGIFIGGRTTVYRKGGNGPRRSQFAIFKSHRLQNFYWFQKETSSPEQTLGTSTNDISRAYISTNTLFPPRLDPQDDLQLGSSTPITSLPCASPAGKVGSDSGSPHGPRSREKEKPIESSAETHLPPSPDRAFTSSHETSRSSAIHSIQEPSPFNELSETIYPLPNSASKRRPLEIVHESVPDHSLCVTEGLVNDLTGPLSGDFHLLSHPPRSASMPSSMSVNRPMPEGAEKMLGKAMGPPESARIASGSCNSGGLAIDQGPLQDGPSRSPFLADTYLANASLEKVVQTRPQAKVSTKMSLTGGSVGFLRRKIIMDIVQKCGGAFPSDRELLYPFVYAWQKEGKLGTPEKHTVTAACKSLYASGKLRQLYFSFKDNKGLMVTRPMMTVQGISPTDPKVKEIQQKVIDIYPRPYIPDEAEVSEDVRAKFSSPQVYGTSRTFPRLEIDHEARVQLQHKPQYVQRIEYLNSARSRIPNRIVTTKFGEVTEKPSEESTSTINDLSDDEAMINSEQPHVRAGPDNTRRFIRRPDLDPGLHIPVRKVERLASIRRPPPARTAQLSTGQNRVTAPKNSILSAPSQHVQPLGRPSGFNTTYGFGKYSPQRQVRYSALEDSPENYFNPSFRAFQPGAIVLEELPGEILQPELNVTGAHPPQSGLSPKEAGTLTSKRAVSKKRVKPYLPSIIAHTQPYPRPIRKYRTKQYLPSIAAHAQPICKPITTKRRNNKPFSKLWSGGNLVSSRTDSRSLSPAPSQSYRFSDGLLSAVSADVSRIKMVYALNTSQTLSIDPWYAHQQMSTIMDPDHRSHSVTGTFFTVFQEPKKFGRRTQTTPHKGGSKADQVYSNWGRCGQPSMDWITPDQSHRRVGFEIEVDNMLCWELEMEDFDPAAFADRSFVNLKLQHPHRLSTNAPICMDRAVNVSFSNIDGRILYKPFTPSVVRKPKVDRKVVSKGIRRVPPVVPAVQAVKLAKRKRQKEPKERFMSRRLTSLPDGQGFGCSKPSGEISSKFDADGRPVKLRRIRGPQLLQSLGEEGERRLIFATLVIRTLTGGLERHIDWVLVARLFAPKFDQMFIQNRWNAVLNKWRFEYERLYIEFQDMFTQAYEDGVVPPIDYDNLENYDWAWLVDWTMKNIEAPSKALPDLPAERSKFDERFTTKETNENNLHVFYETDGVQNLPSRTKSLLKQSYVYPLQGKRLFPPAEESEELAVAKSWIRANIITPNASYNSEFARERLLKFNEATIELGLKELMASRVLSQQNKGRLVPGRNYNISQHVLDRLKKNLEIRNFLCAAAYKRHLDRELEEKDAVDFSPTADDGIVLAVLNMQAHGRVEIRPKNPPMNKFGLTDGGYETRKMDKSRLNFTCEIRLKDTYITGNPLFPLPPPPCQHLGVPMSKIPLWYDIHDKLMPEVWDKVLAATVAILALRPGIDAQKIEKTMRPALEVWELELVLEWMVVAKAAKKAGRGYMVDEWWWLCMDHEEEGEGARTKIGGETNISADEN